MLSAFLEVAHITNEGFSKFKLKENGADTMIPSFVYVLLMAEPKTLVSCIK